MYENLKSWYGAVLKTPSQQAKHAITDTPDLLIINKFIKINLLVYLILENNIKKLSTAFQDLLRPKALGKIKSIKPRHTELSHRAVVDHSAVYAALSFIVAKSLSTRADKNTSMGSIAPRCTHLGMVSRACVKPSFCRTQSMLTGSIRLPAQERNRTRGSSIHSLLLNCLMRLADESFLGPLSLVRSSFFSVFVSGRSRDGIKPRPPGTGQCVSVLHEW